MHALKQVAGLALVVVFLFGAGWAARLLGLPAGLVLSLIGAYLGIVLLGASDGAGGDSDSRPTAAASECGARS